MVPCLKDDHARNERLRCNLEDLRFGCFSSGPFKHQIHFALLKTIPALQVSLGDGDEML